VSTLAILVGAIGAPVSAQTGSDPDQELLGQLGGRTRVGRNAETGRIGYLGGSASRPITTNSALGSPVSARGASRAFLSRYGRLFGVASATRELDVVAVARPGRGRTFVRYRQIHRGVPVIAGELIVQTDQDLDVVSVGGKASPDLSVDTRPSLGAARARRLALGATAKQERVPARTLRAGAAHLAIYDPRLVGDPTGMHLARLVWQVDVRSTGGSIREFVAIDAHHGTTLAMFNQTSHADPPGNPRQRVCNANNVPARRGEGDTDPLQCDPGDSTLVANPSGSSSIDVLGAFRGAAATYAFYARRFGRSSLDDAGMRLISTVRFCPENAGIGECPYPNAFWNGAQMVYGAGFARGDDVIGHELTHGVTEFSSGLLYFYQSGAINEAMSDIFGEFVDLTTPSLGNDAPGVRWRIGEDLPIGVIRNMANPPARGHPDRMGSPLFTDDPFFEDQGGVHTNSGVANKAAFLITDGGAFNGQSVTGLGIDKAAAIWYRANNHLLTSGSDYDDLANGLHQSCIDQTGSTPRNGLGVPSAQGPITAADCTEVDQAIAATEMRSEPTVGRIRHAALCAPGTTPSVAPFHDRIDRTATGWTTNSPRLWGVIDYYATSTPYSLFGINETVVSDSWFRSPRITVPANAFLSFRHFVDLEGADGGTLFDGGVVEYATSPSGPWTDLGPRFVFNGYNGTISSNPSYGNPLRGRQAFGGFSFGWARSRADLSNLAGQRIYLRFRIGTDSSQAFQGWGIDDVRVYRCVAPDTAGPTVGKPGFDLARTTVEQDDTPIPVKVGFTAADPSGVDATFLQRRLGGGPFLDVPLAGRRSTGVTTTVPSSETPQQFRAGARDAVDNVGSNTKFVRIRAIQEAGGTPAVVYTGSWATESSSNYFGGAARHAAAAGRRARVTLGEVTDLGWVTTRGPNRGKAEVWVDGQKKATIDLYSATWKARQVVYAVNFGSPGTHTIEVRVLGTRNAASSGKRVDLDAFEAIGN
jgi:Zn-dependent metalloprotease